MGVQVDQPRHHQQPAGIEAVRRPGREIRTDRGDPAAGEGDVGRPVPAARRVDHAAAAQDEIRAYARLR